MPCSAVSVANRAEHTAGAAPGLLVRSLVGLLLALFAGARNGAAQDPVELHVWGMNLGEPRYGWYALIDLFERDHPNIKVVAGPQDRGHDLQKLLSGVVGNAPPDVFRREAQLFGDIAARGILLPLDDFIEGDKARLDGVHEADYLPGVWQSGMYEGGMYAIPENCNPHLLAYNRKLFREAGLDPDRPPATWDEWLEATRRLTRRDAAGRITQLGTAAFFKRDDLSLYIAQAGGGVFSEDGKRCTLDTPEAIAALTFQRAMYEAEGGREAFDRFVMAASGPEQFDPFTLGRVAMSVEDDWVIYRVMRYRPDFELGVAPVPAPAGRQPVTLSTTHTLYMIPINARHPNEAWDFLRFLNSPEGQLAYAKGMAARAQSKGERYDYTGLRSNLRVVEALAADYAPSKPLFREAFETVQRIAQRLVPLPASPVSGVLRDELFRANQRVAYGQADPKEALIDAEQRVQEALDVFTKRNALPLFRWSGVWIGLAALVAGAVVAIRLRTRGERATGRFQRGENRMGLVFISPWLIGFLLFIAGPMVFSFAMSFCDYDVIHPARYVGLKNYTILFTVDPLNWKSLANTAFMVLALPLNIAVALALALLLNTRVKGMAAYRTIFYLPAITPVVATAVLWYALLNREGLINAGINATLGAWFGVSPPAWLQDPAWSKPAMVLMGLWGAGGGMILWLAGLQGIPTQLYEAAAIDGAGPFRRFWSVTFPLLTPYLFFSLIVGIIGVFQIFAQALILTLGGPADSTLFYVYYLFNNAFRYFKMGYASAQAWVLFAIVLLLTFVQWRFSKRWVHYE